MRLVTAVLLLITIYSCQPKDGEVVSSSGPLFEKIDSSYTLVNFRNDLRFDKEFNIFTYRNFYNGGGVAIGDINNDGLVDIYFTANQLSNKLYLNKGDFQFEDITEKAGVGGQRAWSTGVSMADVNGDGWLDIYVCNSGDIEGDNKQNELFINNGDMTFTESGEQYGLNDKGYSTHAAFFDYDRDGDLDVYLLNNSYQAIGSFNLMQNVRPKRDSIGGDKLYRNDNNNFIDVSEEAGIYGSVIGFGLGVTVGDVNDDDWMDIFVSNDFFERDYLYINNGDGTFNEELEKSMPSISAASMGADMADINNDGNPEIFVTDMLPEPDNRLKQVTTFENWDKLIFKYKNSYHYQFSRNMLHLNNGDGTFSDIGRLSGVEATDWSWGALFFDMDNDGLKDIFVANGIYKDITDLDYLNFIDDEETKRTAITKGGVDYKYLTDPIPVNPIPNYAFKNTSGLSFENKANDWGLGEAVHSNGSAYGDLDNDGDLDLVVNNVNKLSYIYRNNSEKAGDNNRYLKLTLTGSKKNTQAVGAKIALETANGTLHYQQMPTKGFQSSVDPNLVIGLGNVDTVKTLKIQWPNGGETKLENIAANRTLMISEANAESAEEGFVPKDNLIFRTPSEGDFIGYKHKENTFVDFDRDRLTYHMVSTQGPHIAKADVNADGLEDIYIGGAKDQAGSLFIQAQNGGFVLSKNQPFEDDAKSEETDAVFFDADGDGDQDLFVASGGNEFSFGAPPLKDRLYLNDGKGSFSKSEQPLLTAYKNSTSVVKAVDYDQDGDLDLFIGSRLRPFLYGVPADSYLYQNDGSGLFTDVTKEVAPELSSLGMVTDATWTDYDNDGDQDLIVIGEWMTIEVFNNTKGSFERTTSNAGLSAMKGWWNVIEPADLDNDGDIDFVVGNHGLNSRFEASSDEPLLLYINDFDKNGSAEQIFARKLEGKVLPFTLKHDLIAQIPSLKKKYLKYENYNDQTIEDIFTPEEMTNAVILETEQLRSAFIMNNGDGTFTLNPMPLKAQISPIYAIQINDFDNDGALDILLGGNLSAAKPEVGRYDASYGVFLEGDGKGNFNSISSRETGFFVRGDVRDFEIIKSENENRLLISRNNDSLEVFNY